MTSKTQRVLNAIKKLTPAGRQRATRNALRTGGTFEAGKRAAVLRAIQDAETGVRLGAQQRKRAHDNSAKTRPVEASE